MYKVLIVDDDIATLYMLKRFRPWAEYGFSIEGEACDGKEALQKLNDNVYHLIITDIKMPGMDGIEFIQKLRSIGNDTCVIFLSTHSDFQYAKQGITYGVFEYMTKPLEEEVLRNILTRAKAFIDLRQQQEARLNGAEESREEENGVYYPVDHEKQLTAYILNSDRQLEAATYEAFEKICNLYDFDSAKVRILANTMLYNIGERIDEKIPWLKKIEGSLGLNYIEENLPIEAIESGFVSQLTEIRDKIEKYQLNHPDSIIRKICRCVLDNIENEISLEFIAGQVHISRAYVGKVFKQKVECNFNDYVTKVKMEHAKYLILSGDYKNYEISEKLGYKKPDYFSSLFKAYTGLTPMEFKKCNF